jgi:hypothetical protein
MDRCRPTTALPLLVTVLLGAALAGPADTPAAGQAAPHLPDVYQFMVGRDVPEAAGTL